MSKCSKITHWDKVYSSTTLSNHLQNKKRGFNGAESTEYSAMAEPARDHQLIKDKMDFCDMKVSKISIFMNSIFLKCGTLKSSLLVLCVNRLIYTFFKSVNNLQISLFWKCQILWTLKYVNQNIHFCITLHNTVHTLHEMLYCTKLACQLF